MQDKKNVRRQKKSHKPDQGYARVQDPDLFDHTLIHEVEKDISTDSARTRHGFIGKPITTHPLTYKASVNEAAHKRVLLHPECDNDVWKKHEDEGWVYIENDER